MVKATLATHEDSRALTAAERAVLAEAVTRGEALRKSTDQAVSDYGRWLFDQVFGGDSTSAIAHRDDNALWRAIVDVADSVRLRLPPALIESAVLCAAYDKRLNSDAWRALDFARKSRLLKLSRDKLLRQGAQHALSANLSAKATEQYVRAVLREQGEAVQVRLTMSRVRRRVAEFSARLSAKDFARRFEQLVRDADDGEKRALLAELEAAQATLAKLRAQIKKRRGVRGPVARD
jgi:hypothetical protein